jgi:predicted esterase YcpF (UPF0227 family)
MRALYLHGFNSSPNSAKACLFRQWCDRSPELEVVVPALSWDPSLAIRQLEKLLAESGPVDLVVGSSLGGYYATWLIENAGQDSDMKAALVNPAVAPCRHLGREFLGKHRNPYTQQEYVIDEAHVAVLADIEIQQIADPSRYLLLLQTGDEVLDYRLALEYYRGCRQIVRQGGSHSFEDFAQVIPTIIEFAGTGTH